MQEAPEEKERRDVLLNMYKGLKIMYNIKSIYITMQFAHRFERCIERARQSQFDESLLLLYR